MLLALVVLAVFVLFYLFAFDEGMQGAEKSIESVIAHQREEMVNLKSGISRCEEKLRDVPKLEAARKKFAVIKRENQYREGEIASLRDGVSAMNEAISAKTGEFESYKDEYRRLVRGKSKDRAMDQLETLTGTKYKGVTILEVNSIGAHIRFEGGLRRIPYEELPLEMQDEFQFDADQKTQALAAEAAVRNSHESAVVAAKAASIERADERREQRDVAARENALRELTVKQSQLQSLSDEIRRLESAIQNESSKGISHAPQMRDQLEAKKRAWRALNADVARLRVNL